MLLAFLLNAAVTVTAGLTHTPSAAETSLIAGPAIAALGLALLQVHTQHTATRIAQIGRPQHPTPTERYSTQPPPSRSTPTHSPQVDTGRQPPFHIRGSDPTAGETRRRSRRPPS